MTAQSLSLSGALDVPATVPGAVSHRGVVYAEPDGFRPLLLDAHVPAAATGPVPWVLWIHGGGWEHGDRRQTPEHWPEGLLFGAAVDAGLGLVTVDYRLSGEAVYPTQLEDVRAALAFVRRHADVLGLDPERVGVSGESAGGHLAAMLALTAAGTPEAVRTAALLYAVTDLTTLLDLQGREPHTRADAPESRLLGAVPEEDPARARAASPMHHVTSEAPPMLVISGDADRVVPAQQSERLHGALLAAGVDSTLDLVPGADHCFWDVDPEAPLRRVVAYLADRLGAERPG